MGLVESSYSMKAEAVTVAHSFFTASLNRKKMETEIWKDIPGFEKVYMISSFGRVKSFKKSIDVFILSNKNSKGDYLSLILTHKSHKLSTRIHRLVAEAFIDNPDNKKEVNHIDCNKQNNHVNNLEWATARENHFHARLYNKNIIAGMNNYNKYVKTKKIVQLNMDNKILNVFNNSTEAAAFTGVCSRNILQVANKDQYRPNCVRSQAGGFKWRFQNEL